jgi:molybdopterin-binding protein
MGGGRRSSLAERRLGVGTHTLSVVRLAQAMDDAIRIGAAATALGVSIDTLRRWERGGRVTFERRGSQRYMRSTELARLLRERATTSATSARNRMTGVVLSVRRDGVMAQIDLACGPNRIVSLMSREAADQLGLQPGDTATAIVKATTVVVERTGGYAAADRGAARM